MLFYLYSVQVCAKNVSVTVVKLQFAIHFNINNLCTKWNGTTVNVTLETDFLSKGNITFNKQFELRSFDRGATGTINCSNTQYENSCLQSMRELNQNLHADITFRDKNNNTEKFYDVEVEVDTNTKGVNVGLVVGCSVGGVVIAGAIIHGFILYKKKHDDIKQVQDGEKTHLQKTPGTL
ncbi:Hypothetical_protein [Hexamita inflata]|uniref:Hypothetical_protein n=1 Tax=Hexamita inflata TaxID=28002 RepID=A0AA86UJR4_9EUKA|nr:Hypothetical protein HINF_LOCUS48705 [Hexamita inflata]